MVNNLALYAGLADGLVQFPIPDSFKICGKRQNIPYGMEDFTNNICYGQRLFLVVREDNDIGSILRTIDGYYYPLVSKQKWNDQKALLFGKEVLNCSVQELYPVAMHILTLVSQMADREKTLLFREPTQLQKAAGIEKLTIFSELSAVDFLRESLNKNEEEVMLTPYNECLVRFMLAKETAEYQERYLAVMEAKNKHKPTPNVDNQA